MRIAAAVLVCGAAWGQSFDVSSVHANTAELRDGQRRGISTTPAEACPSLPEAYAAAGQADAALAAYERCARYDPDDPERLETIRSRRQLLRELQRKYGDTLTDVLAFSEESRTRFAELGSY